VPFHSHRCRSSVSPCDALPGNRLPWIRTWLKMSSLIASQSTLCLQTRQEAVANDPEIQTMADLQSHGQLCACARRGDSP